MLTNPEAVPSTRRPRPRSLRQQYEEFVALRIEEYKDDLPRPDLLSLGDEAVQELTSVERDQLVLTEIMLRDQVNLRIKHNLKLPSYARWRQRTRRLREAQQHATHWTLDARNPLPVLAGCLEDGEIAVVVGVGGFNAGFLLAAHDAQVVLVAGDVTQVEAAEHRAKLEWLEGNIETLVVDVDTCPGGSLVGMVSGVARFTVEPKVALVILDGVALAGLRATQRQGLIRTLKEYTVQGGAHVVPPSPPSEAGVLSIAADAIHAEYADWSTDRGSRNDRSRWFVSRRP